MTDARVLVVIENDADIRKLIRLTLADDPRIVISGEAATSGEAFESLRGGEPGLIILDHFLEGEVRGLALAPSLRRLAPEARILLLTADDLEGDLRDVPGVDAYLRKMDIERLLPLAQELLGLSPLTT